MKRLVCAIALLVCATCSSASEPSSHPCASIADPADRLACYDRQSPPATLARDLREPLDVRPAESVRQPSSAPLDDRQPGGTTAAVSSDKGSDRRWLGGLLDWREPVRIESTIRALRRRDAQNMVFLLDNEQIWLQDSARPLPFREGDKVTITSGTVGGFFMTAENGTSTRVRRIR